MCQAIARDEVLMLAIALQEYEEMRVSVDGREGRCLHNTSLYLRL
jgi:hypothetical protein